MTFEGRWWVLLQGIRWRFTKVDNVSTDKLDIWLSSPKQKPILLDIREPKEFQVSHLLGAINVPPEMPDKEIVPLLKKGHSIVLYCSVGARSSQMVERLLPAAKKLDVKLYNLEGSIFKWANEGRAIYKKEQKKDTIATKVHPFNSVWGTFLKAKFR